MEQRRLGRTGHMSSVVTFGAVAVGRLEQDAADRAIELVLDRGVNHFDVAPRYAEAEARLGPWMSRIRNRIFLGCKTAERTREGAWAELNRSLERLRTDRLDLYQLHSVGKVADLDLVTARDGAVEALRRFDFDTVMFPLNFVLWANPDYRRDATALLDECARRDVGTHIIKTVAKDPWGDRPRTHQTWYEPFTDQGVIDRAVAFVLSRPVTTLTTVGDVSVLPKVLDAAERFQRLTPDGEAAIMKEAAQYHTPFVGTWA